MNEDLKLVKEVLSGNIDSFNILVNKYELMVLKYVYSFLKDKEASEDITQEVFITVYNKLYTYNSRYKFSNWIIQIAKNKCIDYVRKYRRVYEANLEDVHELKSKAPQPEEQAEFNETRRMILSFLDTLGETDRQILLLRYTQEITFLDISEIMDISESAVKRRFYKCRDKFKEFRDQNQNHGVREV
ncbi:RNA polymerase sigma factor [Clostridium polynesiense]|uniref:RNA polymerase sigma factor n=1 Tax=Clostridium polynesiense TaxID=1325933 RepID=UPI00058BB3EE|nr:sigma-70 family RNA polymerase sigma factor [Clostridium polynesiense]